MKKLLSEAVSCWFTLFILVFAGLYLHLTFGLAIAESLIIAFLAGIIILMRRS